MFYFSHKLWVFDDVFKYGAPTAKIQELFDLRQDVEHSCGRDFDLKKYHDKILSFGSPPTQYVRALVLGQDIPRMQ